MAIDALQAFRKLPGGSQSQLMLCSDGNLWVVKFRNNPQSISVLTSQLIASRIAEAIGLSVPRSEIVQVDNDIIVNDPNLTIERYSGSSEHYSPGLNLGSRFAGTLMPGTLFHHITDSHISRVSNVKEFAGAFVLDVWIQNTDCRQAIFVKKRHASKRYRAKFIDFGHCLGLGELTGVVCKSAGLYRQRKVYKDIRAWYDLQPWLHRVRSFDPSVLWNLTTLVPDEWIDGNREKLEIAVDRLITRQRNIDGLISEFLERANIPSFDCL